MAWFGIGKSKAKEKALRKAAKNKVVERQQTVAKSTLVTVENLTKPNESGWYTIADGNTWMKKHEHIISLIYSNLRLTDFHRDMYYTSAIRNYCRLVQALPASEYHHHSYAGGLIEHTLQVAKYAIIYARKFMFSENNKEIELEEQFDVFAYACFTAALMHDAGKIITDFDLVSWDGTLNPNGSRKATVLMPLNMQQADVGIEYMWRYCATRNKAAHESAAAALIQPIIPVEGLYWLRTCPSLWQQWFHTISGRHNFGGDIAEVIKYCDSHSVEVSLQTNNSKAGSGSKNTRHTLAERYVIAIRQLIESSALPLNRPGAAGFVYEDYLYLVSQRSIEAATPLVKNAGGTGIPKNVATIFSLLCDAGIALRHPVTNDVIHTLHIRLNTGDGWDGELTFLKFPIDEIDPTGVLGLVPADLEITDKTEEKGFNAKQHKKADSSVANDTGSDNDSNEPVFNLAAQMDSLTTANDSKTDSADDILSSVNKLFEDTQSQLLPNHKKGKPKKDNKDKSSGNNAVSNIKEPKEPASGGLMDLNMSDFADIDSVSTSLEPEETPDNSSVPATGGLMDLDMSDFADLDSVSTSPEPEETPDNSSVPATGGLMDLDMSDFAVPDSVSTSPEPEETPDNSSVPATGGLMDLDMSDFANLDTSDSQIHEQSTNQLDESKPVDDGEQPAQKQKAKRPRKKKKISVDDVNALLEIDTAQLDPTKTNGLPDLDAISANNKVNRKPEDKAPETDATIKVKSEDFGKMNVNEMNSEPTNYKEAIKNLLVWLDEGLNDRNIKFNKITNKSNYVFNTKYGYFVCIYTLIDEYNKTMPNSPLKVKRIERILHELEQQRVIHNSITNSQMRVAHISVPNQKPITLKGVYIKREALPKMQLNTSYVDANTCLIEP